MNQRQAKRMVCREVARDLLDLLGQGYAPGSDGSDASDALRLQQACFELVDELLRRGGTNPNIEFEGQLTLLGQQVEDVVTDRV